MTRFYYQAVNRSGDLTEGELDATDQTSAIKQLQRRGFTPIRAQRASQTRTKPFVFFRRFARGATLSASQIALLTDELATMLNAGVTLDRALTMIATSVSEDALRHVVSGLRDDLRAGQRFSDALSARDHIFPPAMIAVVQAGEAAGALPAVMTQLATHQAQMLSLRERIVSASIYPAILAVIAIVSVLVIVAFVLPEFREIFDDMGAVMPWLTRTVMASGTIVQRWWWLFVLGLLCLGWLVRYVLSDPGHRLVWDRLVLRIPRIGTLVRQWHTAAFARTLGLLLENGVGIDRAFAIASDTLGSSALRVAVKRAADRITAGSSFADALDAVGELPPRATQLIRVGEETGHVSAMLLKVGHVYDKQVHLTLQRLLVLLEPLFILGMALVVAVIVLSLLLAVLGMNELPLS